MQQTWETTQYIDKYDGRRFCTGRYALVDAFHRLIWLNCNHELTAHKIQKTFWPKAPSAVFDLTIFKNWNESVVDSDVSLDWQVPINDLLAPLTQISLTNPAYTKTQTAYVSDQLINQPSTITLDRPRQYELQRQMLLYKNIFEKTLYYQHQSTRQEFYNQIDMIFKVHLTMDQIALHLKSLAKNHLENYGDEAGPILYLLGSCYE